MMIFYAACAATIIGAALYLILSRNLMRMLLGFSLLATGVNQLLFLAGGVSSRQPPIVADGATVLGEAADPLAQALILTAIVIGFAVTIVLATLVLRAWRATGSLDVRTANGDAGHDVPAAPDSIDA